MDRQRKRELRELNLKVWAGDKSKKEDHDIPPTRTKLLILIWINIDVYQANSTLDSSLKKNTAFIKRLRTGINGQGLNTFLQEIRTLSLHKYLSEIISACYEGLTKIKLPADVAAGVEIFSALHQRFGPEEFTSYIGWLIGRGLSTPDKSSLKSLAQDVRDKEEKERLTRQRSLLKVVTDLWLVGALRSLDDVTRPEEAGKTKENHKAGSGGAKSSVATHGQRPAAADSEPFPLEVLKDLLAQDDQHVAMSMVVQFIKAFAMDLLGKSEIESDPAAKADSPLVDENMQQRFRNILDQYFDGAKKHVIRDQSTLSNQSKRNAEAYVRSGEIFEDRQANYEKMVKNHDKFVGNLQTLADALDKEMPNLKEKESVIATSDGSIGLVKAGEYLRGEGDGPGIWEDEDERRFYENLVDLKDRVPGILLEDSRKKKNEEGDDQQVGKANPESGNTGGTATDVTQSGSNAKKDQEADQSTAIANKTVGAQVDTLLSRLPDLTSKEAIDEFAVDFCFVNSKASRNRLIKSLQEPPRGRSDLLPLWSRLATTLAKYMQDVGQGIVSHLDDEFRSLQRRKQKDSLGGVRTGNIRYLAELTKFGLVPEHVIFHCLKVSLDDFSRMNIDIICNLLENCGKYLLKNPETSPRMRSFLETLNRKKGAAHISQQERMLIENASYFVDPPERAAIQQKERTPMELFVRKLIYDDLTKRNAEKVIKQIRKLHWEEKEVVDILHKIFVKPHRIKFSNIVYLAAILGALNRYHPDFVISVIDDVMENITLHLELNDFKYNQRRMADARYVGELYAYRLLDSNILFDTMFKIATFGHEGWPKPGVFCPLDPPDDFFRVRLICTIVESCGVYFEKGAGRKKMDFFLTFFQYYINSKDRMPMDTDFLIQDTFGLIRPKWNFVTNLEEAGNAFAEACKENYKSDIMGKLAEDQTEIEEAEGDGRESPVDDDKSSDDEPVDVEIDDQMDQINSPEVVDSDNDDEDEDEHIVVTRPDDERDPEADADFDRELAKMMAESVETRKFERRPNLDIALPMRRGAGQQRGDAAFEENVNGEAVTKPGTVQFSLLSKKGNRQQTKAIDLPEDSNFAVAMRTQQEADKAEQQRIKKLVLNYDLGDDENQDSLAPFNKGSSQSTIAPNTNDRPSSSGGNSGQGGQRGKRQQQSGRKLQLADVDWLVTATRH